MNKAKFFIISICCFSLSLFTLISCAEHTKSKSEAASLPSVKEESQPQPIPSAQITIHKIARDSFFDFLEDPSHREPPQGRSFSFSKEGEWYVRHGSARMLIDDSILSLLGTKASIESYLKENSISDPVETIMLFDIPCEPLTAWIKTTTQNVFITVNKSDDKTAYNLYLYDQYIKTYGRTSGKLKIKNKEILGVEPMIYHDYADVPLSPVLKEMGATFSWEDDEKAIVFANGKRYLLDYASGTLYEEGNDKENLLSSMDGGYCFVYSSEGELFVDSNTLSFVLKELDYTVTIMVERNQVLISATNDN
ncbi:MAG: hypothetical protein IJC46_06880 [Clostridia bacterium]|nr:hypothetical protein [Clostridia bacterium]